MQQHSMENIAVHRQLPDWLKEVCFEYFYFLSTLNRKLSHQNVPRIFFQNSITKECKVSLEKLEGLADDCTISVNAAKLILAESHTNGDEPVRRYRTRSSITLNDQQNDGLAVKRKRDGTPSQPQPKPKFIEYNGKVEYYTNFIDIACACDNLL